MKINILCDAFPPEYTGGIQKSIIYEMRAFKNMGHEVTVITRRLKSDSPKWSEFEGIKVYRYYSPPQGSSHYRFYPLYSIFYSSKLLNSITARNCVIYSHETFQTLGAVRKTDLPVIFRFHAPLSKEIEVDAREGKKYGVFNIFLSPVQKIFMKCEKKAILFSDLSFTTSFYIKSVAKSLYGKEVADKLHVLPLCVDTEQFKYVSEPLFIRRKLNLPLDRTIFLTIRRLVPRTGVQNLIEAFKEVVKMEKKVLLLIGGKGYLERDLKIRVKRAGLENYIKFIGFIPEEKLPLYYQSADFFILPTLEMEGFGLSTLESMSCGTPVIATPVGANREIIGGLDESLLCKSVSPESIAERIIFWLFKKGDRELRKRVRDYCVEKFDNRKIANSLICMFKEIIRKKHDKEKFFITFWS